MGFFVLLPPSVWVSYPLKQGLKPRHCQMLPLLPYRLSQLSIKTRIETYFTPVSDKAILCLSQLSIKTRIETKKEKNNGKGGEPVWVSYPLKQGLKRSASNLSGSNRHVWVSYPLKQGLKLAVAIAWIVFWHPVWVSYPLKQGLKLVDPLYGIPSQVRFESAIH